MSAIRRTSRVLPGSAGLALAILLACAVAVAAQAKRGAKLATTASAAAADVSADPILAAMREELDRSKSHLKMDNVQAPYYIEYRLTDVRSVRRGSCLWRAARGPAHARTQRARVVVRVGDYKQDSYYGPGLGAVDLAPLENDSIALRRQLWKATDSAYKRASEALAAEEGDAAPIRIRPAIRRFCAKRLRPRPSSRWRSSISIRSRGTKFWRSRRHYSAPTRRWNHFRQDFASGA